MRIILVAVLMALASQAMGEKYKFNLDNYDDVCVDDADCSLDDEVRAFVTNEVITKGKIISEYSERIRSGYTYTELVAIYRKQVWVCSIRRASAGFNYVHEIKAECVNINGKNK